MGPQVDQVLGPSNASMHFVSLKGHLVIKEPFIKICIVEGLCSIIYCLQRIWVLPQALSHVNGFLHSQIKLLVIAASYQ